MCKVFRYQSQSFARFSTGYARPTHKQTCKPFLYNFPFTGFARLFKPNKCDRDKVRLGYYIYKMFTQEHAGESLALNVHCIWLNRVLSTLIW